MQKSDNMDQDLIVRDLSQSAAQAFKELEMARQDLKEKELELKEISAIFNQKMDSASKLNQELQNKTEMLMEMSTQLQEQNEELIQRNKELQIKESTYNTLNKELRIELEKVTQKEKDLELQKQYLQKQVQLKSNELMKNEKMSTIGELTSRLSHDLRNPLSVLKAAHAFMKEKPNLSVKERIKYNGRIDRAIQKIVHLVDDVLNYVRISELDLQTITISSILDSTIDSIDVPEGVKIIREGQDAEITCDVRKIEAVFANIITNSIQAVNDEGEIAIRVSENDDKIQIEVEDTGPGMTDSIIEKIFDPLFTTKSHGTGLGLSICKTIVEQHGGTITVKANPTTFTVILPKNM